MEEHTNQGGDRVLPLENIATFFLLGLAFLLPVFFIPSVAFPFQFTKTLLIALAALAAFILFLISRLKAGSLSIPRHPVIFAVWGLPVVYLISAVLSNNTAFSISGNRFEVDTVSFMAVMALLLSSAALLLRSKEKVFQVYLALLASFGLLALFQLTRLFLGSDALTFGVFTDSTSNLIGKWNDLGILFGLMSVLSLITLGSLQLNTIARSALQVFLVVSLLFLAVINSFIVWVVVALFTLGVFIYHLLGGGFAWKKKPAHEDEGSKKRSGTVSFISLATLAVSLVFIIGGASVGGAVASVFNISQIEARPSWQGTIEILKSTYKDDLLFGSGPNTFGNQWLLHKPDRINETFFWDVDFTSGVGYIPTAFVTSGLLGSIVWILFLLLFVYAGVRQLVLSNDSDQVRFYLSLSSFSGALFLWILSLFYIPNVVVIAVAFLFTGIFIATLRMREGVVKEWNIKFAGNPRIGFITVLALVILFLGSLSATYAVVVRYVSSLSFQQAIVAFNIEGDLDRAARKVSRASSFNAKDSQYRLSADINLAKLRVIVADSATPQDQLRDQFQQTFAAAVQDALTATELNGNNYQNWQTLARVYESVIPLGIEGAYESARVSYEKALESNPKSPRLYLTLAQLEVLNENTIQAREFIKEALVLKPDYTAAIFLQSQIEINEGNIDAAIESVESATLITPNNPVLFFQLGLLRYSKNDNEEAISALERAVGLNAVYSNARYFLGLSYDRAGRDEEALAQFVEIERLNPENTEVKQILTNLRENRGPFENTVPPIEEEVEEREGLPIEE